MSSRSALRNRRKRSPKTVHATERRLTHQTLERRELLAGELGPQLISVSANSGENFRLAQQNILRQSPTQLTFRFDGSQQIDAATLSAISIERAGGDGSFAEGNEIRIDPGFLGFGDSSRIVIARFAETLPDDTYRIHIAGYDDTNQGIVGLRNSNGELLRVSGATDPLRPSQQIQFRLELGPQVVAIVPQPITGIGASREQHRRQIYVYFNEDPLSNPAAGEITTGTSTASVVRPEFYNLFLTGNTVENTDDGPAIRPTSVSYNPALNRAVLTFASDISDLVPGGAGTFRLRVGSSQALPSAPSAEISDTTSDVSGVFTAARDLSTTFNATPQSILISGQIEPTVNYPVLWPGAETAALGSRQREQQLIGQPDATAGINTFFYNFADIYGRDPAGNLLENAITDIQRERVREALALYSQHLGVQFIETQDRGLQFVTGDLRPLVVSAITGTGQALHEYRVDDTNPGRGVLILNAAENWFDGYGLSPNQTANPAYFTELLRGIGSLLGIGNTFEQVPGVASGSNPALYNASLFPFPNGALPSPFSIEPDFLSISDIIPGMALHRPEIRDVDMYSFEVAADGRISIETFAQRLDETSLLDTDIKLWKFNPSTGDYDLVARNDDYYSNDSFVGIDVSPNADGTPARYFVGITASGNDSYNPLIENSGMGGRSQGAYQMRVTFQNLNVDTITDVNGTALDGNGDGNPGGDFNFWFRTAKRKVDAGSGEARTLFVDKSGVNTSGNGDLLTPYRTIAYAFSQARPGDIVRILPSAGADGRIETVGDNQAYEIGRGGPSNAILSDGENFNVPRGVTVMIDAGTIIKLRNAKITVGSSRVDDDRSLAALQILGTPVLVNNVGSFVDGRVVFTSYQDESFGVDTNSLPTTPGPGQWAGIEFRNDFDYSEGRPVWETEGIFLDYVAHADIRYGGGSISSSEPVVTPLQMLESRPTLIHNTIQFSSDAAISADPNSFAETNFHSPIYQRVESFTSDYDRVGPDIRGNRLVNNSINGLFVRVRTPAVGEREPMTVSGRFDDFDITHVISEVLVLQGQPGGPLMLEDRPDVLSVTYNVSPPVLVGSLTPGDAIHYRVTFVTRDGIESLASEPTATVTVNSNRNILLQNLPQATAEYAGRRLYRFNPSTGDYEFVRQLDRNSTTALDTGITRGGGLSAAAMATTSGERLLPRFDARLSIDPGLVIKLDTARIETGVGADFYAEGIDGNPVVFTSRLDDQYGAGGTFDTNNDGTAGVAQPGAWSGLVFRQGSSASLDHTVIRYAGGNSSVSGGFATFNPIEILQADVRVANSVISNNASGNTGNLDFRDGVGFNGPATIFVRGSQPTIVNNIIRDNLGAAISINPDSLDFQQVQDKGRGTGIVDRFEGRKDNQGALIAGNRLDGNGINGMLIRNESLTTESVWDDTDIVHVVERFVYAWNHHHRSGLRLKSDPGQSLVVKMQDGGAIVADRYLNDLENSIGGTIQVIGQPGFPVILTSIHDDTVGAGFTPAGLPQNDTNNATTAAAPGDWYGIVLRGGANDRNVAFVLENESAIPESAGVNAIPSTAQLIGRLATRETSSDENVRLGFNVRGTLSLNSDVDVYRFSAFGQTEVFIDIDDTDFGLDTVVELIDINGNILALSNSSFVEAANNRLPLPSFPLPVPAATAMSLSKTGQRVIEGPNTLDAGMRVILPGNSATENEYFVRVRSSNLGPSHTVNPVDRLWNNNFVRSGLSSGQYQLSVRLNEADEIAGSTVRLADIRFATHAIDVPASPFNSPLTAEFSERLLANGLNINPGTNNVSFASGATTDLGNLLASHQGTLRVSGVLGNNVASGQLSLAEEDLDVYRIEVRDTTTTPRVTSFEPRFVTVSFDLDYADQLGGPNTRLSVYNSAGQLVAHGLNSNIADDQGRPRFGNDMANLSAGSAGTLDASIGPVTLPEGTYFVVVSSAKMIPEPLAQLANPNAPAPGTRIIPNSSIRRIAEQNFEDGFLDGRFTHVGGYDPYFGSPFVDFKSSGDVPTVTPLFDATSIVPYTLEDVRMFVTMQGGITGGNRTALLSVDPFTGQLERAIGQFGESVGDLGIRRDGELFAYSLQNAGGAVNPGATGNYLNISAGNGTVLSSIDDSINFRRSNDAFNNTETDPDAVLLVNAMSYQHPGAFAHSPSNTAFPALNGSSGTLTVVGNRSNQGRAGEVPIELRDNLVFSMMETNGLVTNTGNPNTNANRPFPANVRYTPGFGPASDRFEHGVLDVGQFVDSDPRKTGGNVTGLAQRLGSSQFYAVTSTGGVYRFTTSSTRQPIDPVTGLPQFAYSRVINTTFLGTVQRDALHSPGTLTPPNFSSLTFGPQFTEIDPTTGQGRYRDVLFATTTDGWVYTLSEGASGAIEPAGVLVHGRSAVPIITGTGSTAAFGQITGVAFSTREENPWHQTGRRNASDQAHGTFPSVDQTQGRVTGGASLYFGFANGGIVNNDGAGGNQSPGGAHGSSVSTPFSLENYGPDDAPTLYFSYFLEAENNNQSQTSPSSNPANQAVDSLRVFAAGDDGQWQLLATNNTLRGAGVTDEFDYFEETGIPVQPLHDNTNTWRQARIDLSPLAGNKNVQLRFDFSTAGGMQSQFRTTGFLTEIQATPGVEVIPGSTFTLSRSLNTTLSNAVASPQALTTFEFVRGVAINIPAGNAILEGQQISITGAAGIVNLTLTTVGTGDPNEVVFDRADTAAMVASKIQAVLLALDPTSTAVAIGSQLRDTEALAFSLTPERFGVLEIEMPANPMALDGQSLQLTNAIGTTSTIGLESVQDVDFTVGFQSINVTAVNTGTADGVTIVFRDTLTGDVPAFATFSNFQRRITVFYNSAAATVTNRDINAIVNAIDALAGFNATLTGIGTIAFTPPTIQPAFPTDEVYILGTDTADSIATKLAVRINSLNLGFNATATGDQLTILGAGARVLGASFTEIAFNQGGQASQLLPSGNVPIFYHWAMTDGEVREAIRAALVNGLGTRNAASGVTAASIEHYPGFATNRIRVFEQRLVSNLSTLGFSTFLPGDEFGAFASSFVAGSQINPRPGMNNNIEGVYIDDIIIGFAERGELVTNAPVGNSNFVIDPQYNRTTTAEYPNEILVGGYTLEIRQAPDFAVPNDFNSLRRPPNPRSSGGTVNRRDEQFGLGRAFDTNDRFDDAVTLIAPDASQINDGDTFVISNGTRQLMFEFDTNGSVTAGRVRVAFQKDLPDGRPFPAHAVATSIRDAINSTQSRNVLGIVAAGIDGAEAGPSTSTRINLFGSSVVINPTIGQFIKVDLVAAETKYGRETARTLPIVDQENRQATNDTIGSASEIGLANPVTTAYRNGMTDTLIAVGKVGDAVYTDYTNSIFNEWVFGFGGYRPVDDVDAVRIFLNAGDRIDAFAQVVGLNLGSVLTPLVEIFDADTLTLEAGNVDGVNGFVAPRSGFYVVAVSSAGGFGEYQLTIRPTDRPLQPRQTDAVVARYFLEPSDANLFRGQGQLIIEQNVISDFSETGIRATYTGDEIPGATGTSTLERHPSGVALLRNPNTERLVPGTVIVNNVITATQGNGIVYSGITPTDGSSPAPVPFGRIVNNTVVFPAQSQAANPLDVVFLPIDTATIMGPNDDGSSAAQNFGFNFRFFGNTYNQFFVNNNGNLTFDNPLFSFTASGFPQNRPVIAPFWADVDTRPRPGGGSAGTVHLTRGVSPNRGNPVVQMDWVDVGYFSTSSPGNTGATNTFTVYIESHPQGDIVAFRYGNMSWTTGTASGGTNGFGGTGAQIGFDSGDGTNFISLGRPRSQAELDALFVDAPFIFQINPVTGIPGGAVSDGSGILVEGTVSPTILNNVISGFDVGLNIAANSNSTVENGNTFQRNRIPSNRPLASQSVDIPANIPMFEDINRRLYIPAAGSSIIDSSFANLNDRATFFNTVKQPVGISASPIQAPRFDAYGIPRVDDPTVTTPGGIGGTVFIDRGGIDRSDQVQPTAVLVSPIDWIDGQGVQVSGGDTDAGASFVRLPRESGPVSFFEIQLLDPAGTGPDVTTITADTVILTENGVTLIPGVDYTFGYSDNSRLIRLTPLSGLWRPDAVYEITLNNKDRVGLTLPRGDTITDGDRYIVSDAQGRRAVLEFDSGYVMQVPQTLGIEVLGPNTFFNDGDIFTIRAVDGTFRTFEINLSGAVASGNIAINLASAGTVDQIRDTILAAVNSVAGPLNLAPERMDSDSLQIGSVLGHTITGTVAGLNFFGVARGITDGQQFRFQTATENVLFEFTDGIAPVSPGAIAISVTRTDTIEEIAAAIAIAIQTELGTPNAAQAIGDGRVSLSGTATDVLTIANSALTLLGRPGVTGKLEIVVPQSATTAAMDGMMFSVQNGSVTVAFQFTTDPQLVTPNRRVVLSDTDTPTQIAAIIAAEINAAFTGALSPTSTGNVIRLGEQPAIIPTGLAQVLARVDIGTSLLQSRGVSGGAIPVPFIPTSQFAPSLAAASFASALRLSPLQVTSFSPGGGTLLLDNIVSIDFVDTAGNVTVAGQLRPAISDLAGNSIESNRDNAETRFTIIMPEVGFDFGDAPDSYGTTNAQNGARHSVGSDSTPRLGRVIDTEVDGQPAPLSDDRLIPVVANSPNASPLFTFAPTTNGGVDVALSADFGVVAPTSGDSVRIQIGNRAATFEFVQRGVASLTGNIPVPLIMETDTPESITQRLADAIRAELAPIGRSVVVTVDSANPIIRIESLDDEDGVAIGRIDVGIQSYFVFLNPSADANNATANDVLGFLNPRDPAGTTIAVTVTGAGLLDAWVDFDGDGAFDPTREQILQSEPVVDGVNFLNVVTPANAVPGTTWVRFRLSTTGSLRPTGSAVGGEVEDYQISIIPVAPFEPLDDVYSIDEDMTLVVTPSSPFSTLMDNDLNLSSPFLPPRVFIVDQPANGTVTITDPLTGSFDYVPNPAFNGTDFFTYRLSSEGDAATSAPGAIIATVTINVAAINDAPVFSSTSPIELLERDDLQTVTITGVISDALPGRPEAVDEIASQTVSISINTAASTIPAGLFQATPVLVPTTNGSGVVTGGNLRFVQIPDAFGTALLVINVFDNHPTDPRTTTVTITVNIRPVNDAPRLNPAVLGISDSLGPDNQYSVAAGPGAGTILYTSAEDQPLFIPLRRPTGVPGFNRIGLLDVFTVGPNNETLAVDGGNQILALANVPLSTSAGGSLTPVLNGSNVLIGYNYQPPQDFNETFGGLDSFVYTVIDNNPLGGETWDLGVGGLVDDRRTTTGLVQLRVNRVNDAPQFNTLTNTINVLEDSPQFRLPGYAFNIFAGPPATAFDENDPVTGQIVSFAISGLTPETSQMFASAPTVSRAGVLTFTPAPDAFGSVVLEVRATDNGPDNAIRGDVVSSPARLLTINIRPVNDRPVLNTTTPIAFTLNEDAAILQSDNTVTFQGTLIPLRGTGGVVGMLDVFNPGPPNESSALPGGGQTIQLATPIPASTAQGGTLSRVFDPQNPTVLIGLRYTPRPNFNGSDSFIYGVRDDGRTSDLNGNLTADPRESFHTVTLNVLALNDRPQFSGPLSVTVDEDATTTSLVGETIIPNFVTDIAAGPSGAVDELHPVTGQTVNFIIAPVAGNPNNLFFSPPVVSSTGTLSFRTLADANGVAVFTIIAQDTGANNPPLEFNSSTPPRTFTITVNPINDPPTFVPDPALTQISVLEDSGPFTTLVPLATQISPGPSDEVAAGQTVRFEVTVPAAGQALFQTQPNVTDNGFLRFTPRDNAVGQTVVSVVAIDSENARSEPALVTITITEVNDTPIAGNVSFNSNENTVLPIPRQTLLDAALDPDLVTNPIESLRLTAVASISQSGAQIRVLPSGDLEYDPRGSATIQALRPGQTLADTFTYRVTDAADAQSNLATVTVNVAGINDAPTVVDDFVTLGLSGPITIRPLDNDFDVDGTINPLTLEITQLPAFGSVEVRDGSLIYTPFANFRGTDSIRYRVADDLGAFSESATITIDTNVAPIAVNDNAGTVRGRAVEINVAQNDSDPDGQLDLNSIEIITPPARGQAIVLGGGIVRYLPSSDFVGIETFTYTIRDTRGRPSNVGEVRIQVVASELQNPSNFTDVNASGETSPIDALLVLVRLSQWNREGNSGVMPIEAAIGETPLLYYDVDGNRFIEPLDALLVIMAIANQNQVALGEGEQADENRSLVDPGLVAPPLTTMSTSVAAPTQTENTDSVYGPLVGPIDISSLAADFTLPQDDVINTLAIDSAKEESEQRRSDLLEAIDAAWTDASQF